MTKNIRNDVNTLKAVAIVAVVLFHFFELVLAQYGNNIQDYLTSVCGGGNHLINQIVELLLFRGGYLGVDIFLVVSGFLICTSILNSQALPNHQFSLIHFYKRRFYRLSLPLIPLILFCVVFGYFVLSPSIFHELLSETARAFIFASNFYFAKQDGYFSLNFMDRILLHSWYLSLIGQFYIIFPLVVLVINKLLGQRNLKVAIFALTIFTFIYAEQKFILSKADNLYYLSTMRTWELLFGASLAFIKLNSKHNKHWFYIGIILLIAQIILTNEQTYNPLSILFVCLTSAIVILANYQDSRLNNKIMQFVGKSSYSLYLWHWPILVFCSRLAIFEATWLVVSLILVTWLLSYRFEKLDKKYFFLVSTIYFLLAASTIVVLALNKKGIIELRHQSNHSTLNYWYKYQGNGNLKESIIDSTKDIDTLMVGDSNLRHYLDFFTRTINFQYIESDGTISYGKNVHNSFIDENSQAYQQFYNNLISAVKTLEKKKLCKVVFANKWQLYVENNTNLFVSPPYKNDVLEGIIEDIKGIISDYPNCKYYIISQPVRPNFAELNPIVDMYYLRDRYKYLQQLRAFLGTSMITTFKPNNLDSVRYINLRLQQFASSYSNLYFIDRNIPVCNKIDECLLINDNKPIYSDVAHLSIFGGELVGKYILKNMQ